MPVSRVGPPTVELLDVYKPDFSLGSKFQVPVSFSLEEVISIPSNMAELSAEEQERIKSRFRFLGIRLRNDLPGTIPLVRRTLDIP